MRLRVVGVHVMCISTCISHARMRVHDCDHVVCVRVRGVCVVCGGHICNRLGLSPDSLQREQENYVRQIVQPIAFRVLFNLNLQSQCCWSLFNRK